MFEEFYGLSATPFSRDIPTSELYPSIALEETLVVLSMLPSVSCLLYLPAIVESERQQPYANSRMC